MTATGRVRSWYAEEGWGVIDCDETPGGCWFQYSAIESAELFRGPSTSEGYHGALIRAVDGKVVVEGGGPSEMVVHELKTAHQGQEVELEWEVAEQDGYSFRALTVRGL
jgi:CspA family cold shock protein